MIKLRLGCLLAAAGIFTACAANKNDEFLDNVAAKPTAALLTGTDWQIISAHTFTTVLKKNYKKNFDDLLPASGARAVVTFTENGNLSIKGGCNNMGGSWALTGNTLKTSPLVSTMMACDEEAMKLDAAVQELFSDKTITARVFTGVGNSLIRMQTNDDIYFVMQALNKIKQNNASYAGKNYDDILGQYDWQLVPNKGSLGGFFSPLNLSRAGFSFTGDTLTVTAGCGELTFRAHYNADNLNIGPLTSASESCGNSALAKSLAEKNFKIAGDLLGKKPEITLTDRDGSVLTLKGKLKEAAEPETK